MIPVLLPIIFRVLYWCAINVLVCNCVSNERDVMRSCNRTVFKIATTLLSATKVFIQNDSWTSTVRLNLKTDLKERTTKYIYQGRKTAARIGVHKSCIFSKFLWWKSIAWNWFSQKRFFITTYLTFPSSHSLSCHGITGLSQAPFDSQTHDTFPWTLARGQWGGRTFLSLGGHRSQTQPTDTLHKEPRVRLQCNSFWRRQRRRKLFSPDGETLNHVCACRRLSGLDV